MFAFLRGNLVEKKMSRVVLDINGLGLEVFVPLSTLEKLPGAGGEIKLYTYHHLREDSEELYGFFTPAEKELFLMILGVAGIGPKIGLAVLSHISPAGFKQAVLQKDVKTLASIHGLGKKTAERLIVELKDKLGGLHLTRVEKGIIQQEKEVNDALEGLRALGYRDSAARQAVAQALDGLSGKLPAEQIIKRALRFL